MHLKSWSFIIVLQQICYSVLCYEVPPALVEPLTPTGLRVSIPDHDGITLFAFHGNINVDFEMGREAGQMASDVLRKKDGRWTYTNRNIKLKKGDVIYYWIHVVYNGLAQERLFQSHTVTDFFNENRNHQTTDPPRREPIDKINKPAVQCKESLTLVNNVNQCSGKLLFDVRFAGELDKKFTHVVQISNVNEEFVVYDNHDDNSYLENGNLVIKPTLLDDRYGEKFTTNGFLDVTERCSTTDPAFCKRQAIGKQFLPPVISARLTTKDSFSFRYGIVEVRAKLPRGDWVVPELWLLPKLKKYGEINSGKIVIASSFGNEHLVSENKEIGNSHLYSGLQVGQEDFGYTSDKSNGLWSDDFHTFKVIWNPELISFHVDNKELGHWNGNINPRFLNASNYAPNAPFNEEFYITLGFQVGGTVFPDHSVNNGRSKPWRNSNADIMRRFYLDKPNWYSTWDTDTKLNVEYVKVWAL